MPPPSADVVVAGHLCLDVMPAFGAGATRLDALLTPGRLVEVGPPLVSTGGAVSNTGLTLHRLGFATRLLAKVGDDLFGRAVRDVLNARDPRLADGLLVAADVPTSYSVVLSPPGMDRIFLHCPGANDRFAADEIPLGDVTGARVFHFGYPPLMQRIYADGGRALAALFRKIREAGVLVSLDMAQPDPDSEAGEVDWQAWLAAVLPHVDLFAPSLDELLYMLDRPRFDRSRETRSDAREAPLLGQADGPLLRELGTRLIDLGAAAVVVKLGDRGLYLQTASRPAHPPAAPLARSSWRERQLYAPCFRVDVQGTTGAGDATIGGLLGALLRGLDPEEALTAAVAVGACSVEAPDAVAGIPTWDQVQARIADGWTRRSETPALPDWRLDPARSVWHGPADVRA